MSIFKNQIVNQIDEFFQKSIDKKLLHNYLDDQELNGRTFTIDGKEFKNFASCSYLGLELDKRVIDAICIASKSHGASFIMSRTYSSSPLFKEFESLLTQIFESNPVVTPSTTLGSFSFMHVFVNKNDIVLLDQQVHSSIQMAASIAKSKNATVEILRHSHMEKLEAFLESNKNIDGNIWYCADGIYSMFGDTVPVNKLIELMEKYPNFYCYIDDAHGMSIHGKYGRGFVLGEQEKQHPKMIVAISLSKSFGMGCGGALVFPNEEWQRKFQTCAPAIIFSSPIPPPMLGAGIALAKIHLSQELPKLQEDLKNRIKLFRSELNKFHIETLSEEGSPIQYIKIGCLDKAISVAEEIKESGNFINIACYPAVPRNANGIRLTLSAHMTDEDIKNLAKTIALIKIAILE